MHIFLCIFLVHLPQSCTVDINLGFFIVDRPAPVTYVPPTPDESEEAMFRSIERGINFDKYDEIPVEVTGKGKETIVPIQSFSQAQLYETFQENVRKSNYTKPTPVQKYAIPAILGGRDVMACAQTGSGKTVNLKQMCSFASLQKKRYLSRHSEFGTDAGKKIIFITLSVERGREKETICTVTLLGKTRDNGNCIELFFIATHLETLKSIQEHSSMHI